MVSSSDHVPNKFHYISLQFLYILVEENQQIFTPEILEEAKVHQTH